MTRIGNLVDQALDMSRRARMQRAREMGFDYVRRTRSPDSPIQPGSEADYAMFAEAGRGGIDERLDALSGYGESAWLSNAADAVDVADIQPDIVRAIRRRGLQEEYQTTAAQLAREAAPENIVDSAGLWDAPEIVQAIWEDVLEPRGIRAVRTPDGLIRFPDEMGEIANTRSVNAAFDPAKRDSSNLLAGVGAAAVGAGLLAPQEADANVGSVGRLLARQVGDFDPRFDPRVKEADRISSMTVQTLDRGTTDVPTLRLSDFEGQPFVTSMSDRTAAGGTITGINDVPLSRPVDLRGGQDFMFENPGQVWASAKGPAGQILRAGRETGADAPLFLPWRMAPTGGDFASMTGETMLSFASSNMRPGAKRSLNARLRRMIPNWPGLDDAAAVDAFRAAPDSVRKAAKNMMDVEFRDRGGLNIGEARLAVADPAQVSARDAGIQSVGRIDVASDLAPSTHPSYPYGVPGEGVGRIDADVGVYELLPDLAAERGVPDPLNPRPTDIRALQMGAKRGVITEDILRNLQARGVNVADLSGPALVAAAVSAGLMSPQEAEAGFSSAGARELLERGKDAFMGSPRITRDANAADLRPRAGASAMRAEPEPFLDRYTVRHGESGSTVFDGDRPVASYDAFNTLVVDPEYRREGIASELIAQRRTMFPDQPPATERTRGAQAAQESAWRRIERGAEGFARPGAMAATGAAGALASFLDMRSAKQDTPYKRFIAEGQRAVEQAIGAGESIGNLAASILAEPIAGYAGLVAGPEAVERTRDYFAPQSMSPAAQQQMIGLGNTLVSAGQQIMSGLDAAGQAVGVDRLSDYARYAPGYWAERAVPALQQQFGTQAGSVVGAALRTSPEALSMLSLRPTSAIFRATRAAREAL